MNSSFDDDDVSRYVDSLVYQYIINASRLHTEYVTIRQFACIFDVFIRFNNPLHDTTSGALSLSITTLLFPLIPTLYHTPMKISIICNFGSFLH